jgi:hypothetical protein
MRFKFIGSEHSEVFGFQWMTGTVHDVTDEHAIRKLSHNALFEAVDAAPEAQAEPAPADIPEDVFEDYVKQPPKRRGRSPNAVKAEDGDQN